MWSFRRSTPKERKKKASRTTLFRPGTVFFLILVIAIGLAGLQNSAPLEIGFLVWGLKLTTGKLVWLSSIFGAACVAVIALPKLARGHFTLSRLKKRLHEIEEVEGETELSGGRIENNHEKA